MRGCGGATAEHVRSSKHHHHLDECFRRWPSYAYREVSLVLHASQATHRNLTESRYHDVNSRNNTPHTAAIMSFKSWLSIAADCHFSLANIPFGIISTKANPTPRPAIAIGEYALDLDLFTSQNGFSALSMIQPHQHVFSEPTLNAFAALGRPIHAAVRKYLQTVFLEATPFPNVLKDNKSLREASLVPLRDVTNHLPMHIGDYTDFYAGLNHAFTVGELFRGAANALQPNYKHLPVGYHGRASSIVISGTPVRRPIGQVLENPEAETKKPVLSACRKLDIELELGAFICKNNNMGEPIPINEAENYIFGVVLLNDWSARDIQAWEYVPLGPFTAKNFASTISPWIVLSDALEPFRASGLENDTEVLDYLKEKNEKNVYDIKLEVELKSKQTTQHTQTRHTNHTLLQHRPVQPPQSLERQGKIFFSRSIRC